MNQVLSQQEIDSLLNALNSGEINPDDIKEDEEKNKVRSYDFRRPIKLSKEYINTLYMIFENFSKMAGNTVSNLIHTNVDIKIGAIEQVSYDEFIHSIPNPTLLGLFHAKQLKGSQIIEINPQFCSQVIDLILGGSDSSYSNTVRKKDNFTDIELGVLEEVVLEIFKAFEASWSDVIDIDTELDDLQTNPQLLQNMSPNEPIVLTSFVLQLMGNKSFMNICIPYMSFEDITDKLSMKNWFDFDKDGTEDNKEVITENIKTLEVDLEVDLGRSLLTIEDFLHLELGDIIKLDKRIDDPLKMYVEDRIHFLVKPGKVDNRFAVEILQYIEEDVE
ncbi:MAG: flagellar motor switch protein FliM [Tissierellia bacterium]|nr:flagellar motor switch protein FliM [Tissierellia bacterium]MDD4726867.1 flagellar motor switch protein FliM [Tissierellia bacterium]